mmetsp:Transcript_44420/g.114903  ORF Transcript_44420/g.114903 Transcript_44420/m.114903 type:complete len:206 (+) Transcript_44420:623-1240(+)
MHVVRALHEVMLICRALRPMLVLAASAGFGLPAPVAEEVHVVARHPPAKLVTVRSAGATVLRLQETAIDKYRGDAADFLRVRPSVGAAAVVGPGALANSATASGFHLCSARALLCHFASLDSGTRTLASQAQGLAVVVARPVVLVDLAHECLARAAQLLGILPQEGVHAVAAGAHCLVCCNLRVAGNPRRVLWATAVACGHCTAT